MIKVSELKKCGIEVVAGDLFINEFLIMDEFNPSITRHQDTMINDTEIYGFAPRKNTGVEPRFNCDVDLVMTHRSGKVKEGLSEYIVWDKEGGDDFIESWIPSMERLAIRLGKSNQVDINSKTEGFNDSDYINGVPFSQKGVFTDSVDAAIATLKGMGYTFHGGTQWKPPLGKIPNRFYGKPVTLTPSMDCEPAFTQAMADAGEFPPVGSYCRLNLDPCAVVDDESKSHSGSLVSIIDHRYGLIVCVLAVDDNSGWVRMFNDQAFRPIQTERELITSELVDIISSKCALKKASVTDHIANLIYDAGYRKTEKCNA